MNIDFSNFLVIDIETVGMAPDYTSLPPRFKGLWDHKSQFFREAEVMTSAELFEEKAGIFAEFGKIVTIAVGFFYYDSSKLCFKVKAFYNNNEKDLLNDFKQLLSSKFEEKSITFCAHNGKEFDYPYIARRMLVNGISLPSCLQFHGKKPWEINHIDTMEMWKFGDRKAFTSLDLLAALFGIQSSKSDLDGSRVHETYYKNEDLNSIAEYCMNDVVVTAQLFLKLNGLPLLDDDRIEITNT
jgi:hypothetical protein